MSGDTRLKHSKIYTTSFLLLGACSSKAPTQTVSKFWLPKNQIATSLTASRDIASEEHTVLSKVQSTESVAQEVREISVLEPLNQFLQAQKDIDALALKLKNKIGPARYNQILIDMGNDMYLSTMFQKAYTAEFPNEADRVSEIMERIQKYNKVAEIDEALISKALPELKTAFDKLSKNLPKPLPNPKGELGPFETQLNRYQTYYARIARAHEAGEITSPQAMVLAFSALDTLGPVTFDISRANEVAAIDHLIESQKSFINSFAKKTQTENFLKPFLSMGIDQFHDGLLAKE